MDREKVIKALEVCIPLDEGENCPPECPYYRDVCSGYSQVMRDALALLKEQDSVEYALDVLRRNGWKDDSYGDLLKEQEAMKPISKSRHGANPQIQHFCRRCNAMLFHHKQKYCIECGQEVKWE